MPDQSSLGGGTRDPGAPRALSRLLREQVRRAARFVHEDGEPDATVFHGDVDWEPRRITDADGLPDAGDLILNDEERRFVIACWIATAWRREGAQAGRSAA